MADARVLRDLAEEVERLGGPSRDVDAKIGFALSIKIKPEYMWGQSPRCTGSIDAAAKLMPEGWSASLRQTLNGGWSAWARRAVPLGMQPEPPRGCAKTEALARTACALRALAADLEWADADL